MADNARVRWNVQRKQWSVVVEWQGKWYYFSKYLGRIPTGRDKNSPCPVAVRIASDINSEIDKGIFNPARHKRKRPLHLRQYSRQWLKDISVEAATLKAYKGYFKNHIVPALGDMYLIDINYDVLRRLQRSLNLANKTKKNIMGCIHTMLVDARRAGHIQQVPEFPGFKGKDAIEEKAPEWIDADTQETVLGHIPPADRFIFRFIFATGCRVSEARAFRWVDIKKDHIIFRVTFDLHDKLKPIKNRRQRLFPMTEDLHQLFTEIPRNLTPHVFVASKSGRHYTKNINRDYWNPACKKAGITIALNNAGRHSFANQLLEATDNISLVSKALGHSSIGITKKHYGDHSVDSMRRIIDNVRDLRHKK